MNAPSPGCLAVATPAQAAAATGRAAFLPLAVFLCTAFAATPAGAHASVPADSGLVTGADLSDCRSALHLGLQTCDYDATASAGGPALEHSRNPAAHEQALEERVDRFLASYGKPPREAVRALLEPSDDNIRSYLRSQDRTLSLAGYVAARMTALKNEELALTSDSAPEKAYRPAFPQMRLYLYQTPLDPQSAEAMRVLGALAREAPALRVGVKIVGRLSARQLQEQIARIDPALSVALATRESVSAERLPFVQLEDLRSGRSVDIDARTVTLDGVKASLAALRGGAPAPGWVAPQGGNSGAIP
jgi:hypothetical protein